MSDGNEGINIAKANSIILDALQSADSGGLNLDDLFRLTGNVLQRKEISMRLYDLMIRDKISRLPGDLWILKPQQGESQQSNPDEEMQTDPQELPTIILPGSPKFSSYKNSLQEYCQKRHGPVPTYHSKRNSLGIVGVVTVFADTYEADTATSTAKDADQRAAFTALKKLGYIPETCEFGIRVSENKQGKLKRRSTSSSDGGTPAKQVCGFSTSSSNSYKSALHELSQKNKLDPPVYNTVQTDNGYFTTITFNNRQFKSSKSCGKKKESEQNAAAMAMKMLSGEELPPEDTVDVVPSIKISANENLPDVDEMIKSARAASNTPNNTLKVHPTSNTTANSLKNRLQEYCQRMRKPFPEYMTNFTGNTGHIAFVQVNGKVYQGEECPGKKAAEMSAAKSALIELGLMANE